MIRLSVDPREPEASLVARAAGVIKAGGLAVIPTDTFYGLAVNPFDADAVHRVFLVKGRGGEKALPLVASDSQQVQSQLGSLNAMAAQLADRFWPGPLTLIVPAPSALAAEVTGGTGRVGVRVPAHLVCRRLSDACGSLLTATSANFSGQPASSDPAAIVATLGAHVDVVVDAGTTPGGAPSTIVDVTGREPVLVRAGAIAWEEVVECLR